MNDNPRILLFTGDGKGKTTAALGMALRAAGHGQRVCVVQFVKGNPDVGEVAAAVRTTEIEIVQTGLGFVPPAGNSRIAEHRSAAQEGLDKAREAIAGGRYSMVILDEICVAVNRGLLDEQSVVDLVRQSPRETCLVLTGRGATPRIVELADTVTEMRCIKHGYQAGWPAQKGVEL